LKRDWEGDNSSPRGLEREGLDPKFSEFSTLGAGKGWLLKGRCKPVGREGGFNIEVGEEEEKHGD